MRDRGANDAERHRLVWRRVKAHYWFHRQAQCRCQVSPLTHLAHVTRGYPVVWMDLFIPSSWFDSRQEETVAAASGLPYSETSSGQQLLHVGDLALLALDDRPGEA